MADQVARLVELQDRRRGSAALRRGRLHGRVLSPSPRASRAAMDDPDVVAAHPPPRRWWRRSPNGSAAASATSGPLQSAAPALRPPPHSPSPGAHTKPTASATRTTREIAPADVFSLHGSPSSFTGKLSYTIRQEGTSPLRSFRSVAFGGVCFWFTAAARRPTRSRLTSTIQVFVKPAGAAPAAAGPRAAEDHPRPGISRTRRRLPGLSRSSPRS